MPFLRALFPLFFLLLVAGSLAAQPLLRGHITAGHRPLPGAGVYLLRAADSAVLAATQSDSLGSYTLQVNYAPGDLLRVGTEGYTDALLVLRDTLSPQPLDVALKAGSRSLAGITVSAAKPLIERKVDRTIFNVESSTAAVGGDALDALKRAPGVRVSDNSISIAGKSTVNVMINDKLLQVSGEELANVLKSISADNLSRIEIITTPPARYDAAGNAGLINIITKKLVRNGLNGNVTASYMQRTGHAAGGNGNFNYRHDRLNIYGYGNVYRSVSRPDLNITTTYPDQQWVQHSAVMNNNVFNRMQLGADYNLTPRSVVGVLYTLGNGGDQYYGDASIRAEARNLHTAALDSFIFTRALTRDQGVRNVGNVNYQWKSDSGGRKLNIDLDYFNRVNRANRDLSTANYYPGDLPTGIADITRTSGTQRVDIRSGKIDVEWPVAFAKLSFGGKAAFVHNTSDNLFEYLQGAEYRTDTGKTNRFDYRENTQALYLSAQKEMGKWEAQLGLRGEYTQTKSYSATLDQTVRNRYLQLFPTVYLQYNPDDNHSWNLNYSRRIDRPDFWGMNPFRTYFTATSYSQGNPFLQPAYSNNLELSYTWHTKYSVTLYTELVRNLQTRVSFLDTANKAYSFNMANAGSSRNYGLTVHATLNPAKWWDCVLTGTAWYGTFSSAFYGAGPQAYSRPAATLEASNNFRLNKARTLIVNLNIAYNSPQLEDFDLNRSNYNLEAGIKALLLQQRLILFLSGYDICRTERVRAENLYNGVLRDNYYDERTLRIGVTWKFGSSEIKAKRERTAGSEEESRVR